MFFLSPIRRLRPNPRQGDLAGILKQLRSGKKPFRRRHALRLLKLPGIASLRLQPDLLISDAHGSNLSSQGKNSRLHCPRRFAGITDFYCWSKELQAFNADGGAVLKEDN